MRKFTCEGHVGMATLDAQGRFLIIASCGDINFSDNLNDLPFNGDESVAIEKRGSIIFMICEFLYTKPLNY